MQLSWARTEKLDLREASEQRSGTARRILLKAGDAGMELSKRRIRRMARRLGMATVNELEKRVAVCHCT